MHQNLERTKLETATSQMLKDFVLVIVDISLKERPRDGLPRRPYSCTKHL